MPRFGFVHRYFFSFYICYDVCKYMFQFSDLERRHENCIWETILSKVHLEGLQYMRLLTEDDMKSGLSLFVHNDFISVQFFSKQIIFCNANHFFRLSGPPPEVKIEPDPCYELLPHMPRSCLQSATKLAEGQKTRFLFRVCNFFIDCWVC